MKRAILLTALILFIASAAHAATSYPSTIMDSACTDSYDTPTAPTAGFESRLFFVPSKQISGSADNRCDHDSRILTGALTADTSFGPFKLETGQTNILMVVDADTVSNDTDTWRFRLQFVRPHDGVKTLTVNSATQATEGDKYLAFGSKTDVAIVGQALVAISFTDQFYILYDQMVATSWAGDISLMAY